MIPERLASVAVVETPPSNTRLSTGQNPQPQDGGFIPVRASRRGTQVSPRQGTGNTGKAIGEINRDNQVLPQIKETVNTVVSNKYGCLEMDTIPSGPHEDGETGEANKENQDVNINKNKKKETLPRKENLIFGGKASTMYNSIAGTKEKWAGNNNKLEGTRGKPRKSNNKPVRGLVFGPTRGEVCLSESGKRLRVEGVDVGRAGGTFSVAVKGAGISSEPLRLRDEEVENPMDSTINETEQQEAGMQTNLEGEDTVLSLA